MIIGLGSDICNIRRVEKAYERFGGRFLARCFGAEERRELVVHLPGGRPAFRVSGQAEAVLKKIIPASRLWLSLSDDYPLAQAVVIIESC